MICYPMPEAESSLPFTQLWDEEEEEDMGDSLNDGCNEPTVTEDQRCKTSLGSPTKGATNKYGLPWPHRNKYGRLTQNADQMRERIPVVQRQPDEMAGELKQLVAEMLE